ncbi:MAG: hypothetical protein ACM3UZ_12005 [Acidobacteriota bacterium]
MEIHPSNSIVQQEAESIIIKALEQKLGFERGTLYPANIKLGTALVKVDGYNEEHGIICEVYAHIGKLKPAQSNKSINDVMKMLLIERKTERHYRKIIVVCDSEAENQLKNNGWKALAIQEFGVEVMRVEVNEELRQRIIEAQRGQYR